MTRIKRFYLNYLTLIPALILCLLLVSCQEEKKSESSSSSNPSSKAGLPNLPNTWSMDITSHDTNTTYGATTLFYSGIKGTAVASGGVAGLVNLRWETYVGGVLYYSGNGGWLKSKKTDGFYGEWIIVGAKLVDSSLNRMRIIAYDEIGNKVYKEVLIAVDATKPTMTISSPALVEGEIYWTNQSSITVDGIIADNISVSSGTWANSTNSSGGVLSPYSGFSQIIPLDVGSNSVQFVATDPSGNNNTKNFVVTRDVDPPLLAFTAPTTATTFYSKSLAAFTLEGTMSDSLSGIMSASWINTATGSSGNITLGSTFTISNISVIEGINPVTLTIVDKAGNSTVQTLNYIVSTSSPVIASGSFSINGGASIATSKNVSINLQASDTLVPITHVCFKRNDSTAPELYDSCWNSVTPSVNLNLVGYTYSLGSLSLNYKIYAWVKNSVGSVSEMTNSGLGTIGHDKAVIDYQPIGKPPKISGFIVANTDIPSAPIPTSQLSTSTTPIIIKWKVSDVEGLAANPIKLSYTTNFEQFVYISSSIPNAANGACTIDHASSTIDNGFTGCFRWSAGVPASGAVFFVRIEVMDSAGMVSTASSPALNSTALLIAGNLDRGIGVHASALATQARNSDYNTNLNYHDAQSFVVSERGDFYILDLAKGLIKIDMQTGNSSIYIALDKNSAAGTGDGGNVTSAKLKAPIKITLDHSNRLYILDYDRIRRVDLANNTIERFIGGGVETGDPVTDKLNLKIGPYDLTSVNFNYVKSTMVVAPNGDMIFSEKLNVFDYSPNSGFYLRYYDASTGELTKIIPSGLGADGFPTLDVATCRTLGFGFEFDLYNGDFINAFFKTYTTSGFPDCSGTRLYRTQVGSWVSTGPHFDGTGARTTYGKLLTGHDGKIYMMSRDYASLHVMNSTLGTWTKLAGSGDTRGECADGTIATSCNIDFIDTFATKTGEVYIREQNRIRRIDSANKMITVVGQNALDSFGSSALASRIGWSHSIGTWKAAGIWKYTILDGRNWDLLSVDPAGTSVHLAGNGIKGLPTAGVDARTQPLAAWQNSYTRPHSIVQDSTTGDLWMAASTTWIGKMTMASPNWSLVIGGGATNIQDPLSNGLTGNNVKMAGYMFKPIGLQNNKLLVHYTYYNAAYMSQMKLYDIADSYRQSHFSGNNSNAATVTWSADGTATSTANIGWVFDGTSAYYNNMTGDWHVSTAYASGGNRTVHKMTPGGNLSSEPLANYPQAIIGKHDASNNVIYYCKIGTHQIYKKNVTTTVETEILPNFPGGGVRCTSQTILYNSERNTIIIPIEYIGSYGVIEIPAN